MTFVQSTPQPGSSDDLSKVAEKTSYQLPIAISGLRCLAQYLVLPVLPSTVAFIAPVSIALHIIASTSACYALRKFLRSKHRWRFIYAAFTAFVVLNCLRALTVGLTI